MKRALAVIILVHLLLGLIFSFYIYPGFLASGDRVIYGDEYDILAWNMVQGKGYRSFHGELSVIRGPGYPLFLASIYFLTGGHNYWAAQLGQILISACTIVLLYFFVLKIFNRAKALIACAIFSLHPLIIWFVARLYLDVFLCFAVTATLLLLQKYTENPDWKKLGGLAILLTYCFYTKTIVLFIIPLAFIYMLVQGWKVKTVLRDLAIIMVILVLLVAPWTYRNYKVTGQFVPMQASLALPLLGGHFEALNFFDQPFNMLPGLTRSLRVFPEITTAYGYPPAEHPYRSLQEELNIDRATVRFMIDYYKENPWMFIQNSIIRYLYFWYLGFEVKFSIAFIFISAISLAMIAWTTIKFRKNKMIWLPLWAIAIYSGIHAFFIGQVRVQVLIVPMMAALMAPAIYAILNRFLPSLVKRLEGSES